MTGIFILLVFFVFAGLMYTRRMPALLAVPAMAVVMALVAGVPVAATADIVAKGSFALAPVFVTVIAGAMLARVTLDTGIAASIVNFAAEFGGEQPAVIALVLSLVVALLFVTLSGLGAIIMVGSVVLPIMMTTGVPRKIASTLFLMAFALGYIFNIVNWKFYTQLFGIAQQQMYRYALILAAIDLAALCLYAFISFRGSRGYATWAVRAPAPQAAAVGVPWYALITPILPVLLYFVVRMDPIPAFILSSIYGVAVTRPRSGVPTLVAAVIRGVEDVAPAIVLFIGIGMLFTATKQPQLVGAMQPLANIGLRNPLLYVAIFGVLSPLTLYRGPLNPFGVGIAVFTVLLASHALTPVVLVAAVMAVVQVQNVCDPTNTQNVWVANFTGVPINEITRRTLPYQTAVAIAACLVTATAAPALFGIHPFSGLVQRADAAPAVPPGLFVGSRGAYRIGVGDDGTSDARSAAPAVIDALAGAGVHAFAAGSSPNAADCSAKDYAAYIRITATRFELLEGTDLDVGVKLIDCGGWDVTEFHDHAVLAQLTSAAVRQLALQGVARMHEWAGRFPQRWSHLMAQGLAYQAGDPPAYYYALFKTVDGNMRAYVRAGGPAYAAGLRTNDVIEKLDGLYWWEYGTFQTQARAYDGRPHRFELQRDGQTLQVQLGEAFTT